MWASTRSMCAFVNSASKLIPTNLFLNKSLRIGILLSYQVGGNNFLRMNLVDNN